MPRKNCKELGVCKTARSSWQGAGTRRDFMTRAAAMGITIAAATTMWGRTARAAPVKGGHLRLGLAGGSTTDSLDPSPWSDTFMVMLGL